jgi:DNA-binding CsgD family transcriptional regulator/tetratricopeptide (TPR) repeat protein
MTLSSASSGALVGRDDERDRLGRLLPQDATGGSGCSVWIEGEPGIGKSALLQSLLDDARALGCQLRWAEAEEFGRRIPLNVVAECLGVEPGSADPELAGIADLLSGDGPAASDPVATATDRLLGVVDRLTARGPVVLAIDDLQWADEASILFLHRLSRIARRRPLLVVGVCRPVPRRSDVVTLKRGLIASGAAALTLTPLTPSAVTRIAADLVGADRICEELRQVTEQAGGNPLYLKDLVTALAHERRVELRDDATADLDTADAALSPALAETIADRLGFLSGDAIELLRSAALLGPMFSVTDLGAVVGRSALELTAALEEATAAGLLVESGLLLAFRHTLIRRALYERTSAGLRLALHSQAARALADAGLSVERVAEQLLAALGGPGAVPVDGWTVDWLLHAGRALVSRDPRAAAELLRLAVSHLPSFDPRRESLEAILAPALALLGHHDEAVRLAEKVLAATGDPARAAEMSWAAGWAMIDGNRQDEAQSLLSRALRAPGLDKVWSARLHAMLAGAAVADGDLQQAEAATRIALTEADGTGDRPAAAAALNVAGVIRMRRCDLDAAVAYFDRALAVAEPCEDPVTHDLRLRVRQNRAYGLLAQERHAEADIAARELLAEAQRTASPPRLACVRILNADVAYHAGRWEDAVAGLDAAATMGDLIPERDRRWLHGLAAVIAVHRDDQATAEAHLAVVPDQGARDLHTGAHHVPLAHALLAERRDLTDQALAILAGLLDRADGRPAAHRPVWLPTLVRLALQGEDDRLLARAAAAAAAPGGSGAGGAGAAIREALAEHCSGLIDADAMGLGRAVESYRAAGRPLQLAQTLEDVAVVLAGRGDARAARTAHAEASELYLDLGAAWDLLRADTRLRQHGVRRRRGPRRRSASGWEALTPAELTIARLVADGHPNPDIAASLFVSRRTVEVHVSHILSKLGLRSRVEIACEAVRRLAAPGAHPTPVAQAG